MQEVKFKDAIRYYDPIVKRLQESLVDITAIVLANLCVSYIMTSQVKVLELRMELGPDTHSSVCLSVCLSDRRTDCPTCITSPLILLAFLL
jgi:hypothetical protein